MIAVWIYRHSKIGNFLKTGFLLPMAIPVAAVVLLWRILFDDQGLLNGVLDRWGTGTCEWMDTRWAFVILVVSYIWKNLGYHIVLWLAGLSMIPDQIYEAAQMSEAGTPERAVNGADTMPVGCLPEKQ